MPTDLHRPHRDPHQQCHQSSASRILQTEPTETDQPATAMLTTSAQLDQPDQRELQEFQDSMESQDLTVFQESELMISPHNASRLDASPAHRDQLDHQELSEDRDHVDFQDQRDRTETQEETDSQDTQESRDPPDQSGRSESQDHQERRDAMPSTQLEDRDQRDQREIRDHQDHQGKTDSTDHQESQDQSDQKDQLEDKDARVQTESPGKLDRTEDQERTPSIATAQTELQPTLSLETADTETSNLSILLLFPNKRFGIDKRVWRIS